MDCPHCQTASVAKNGTSRHGHQRWRCPKCQKIFGERDHRLVDPAKREAALAQYMEGVGQRATERLLGVSHNSITNWVKAEVCGKVLQATPAEKVAWVEADELWTYASKKDACWLWWAIDRGSKCVLGWSLGDRAIATAERLDAQLPHAAHIVFATDFWHPYGKIFAEEHHVQGKTHTFTIESLNNRIRCYLARLKRKTHNYLNP